MVQGAVVANYPWDGSQDKQTRYSRSPDDATFVHLARTYANAHGSMHASKEFPQGITNGAAWYPLWGGLQVCGSAPADLDLLIDWGMAGGEAAVVGV